MASKDLTRISIYVPLDKKKEKPLERLHELAKKRDRSLNYMMIEAINEFVKREGTRKSRK